MPIIPRGPWPALLALMLALMPSSPTLAGETCPPPGSFAPPPTVAFSSLISEPVYSGEKTRDIITRISGLRSANPNMFTMGLTRSLTELSLNVQTWQVPMGNGRLCVGLSRVEATWRISGLIVDIASNYSPGGCNYRIIRDHEDQHVAIHRTTFHEWAPRAEAVLRQAAQGVQPTITQGVAAPVAAAIRQSLTQRLDPIFDKYRADLTVRNAAIDTPENYARTAALCPRW